MEEFDFEEFDWGKESLVSSAYTEMIEKYNPAWQVRWQPNCVFTSHRFRKNGYRSVIANVASAPTVAKSLVSGAARKSSSRVSMTW